MEKLKKWENRFLMKFNKGKCQAKHLQIINALHKYSFGVHQLECGLTEKILGVMVNDY